MPRRAFSPQQIAHAIALAQVEGSEQAAKRTGITARTIRVWMEKAGKPEMRIDVDALEAAHDLALATVTKDLAEGRIRGIRAATVFGILRDKKDRMAKEPPPEPPSPVAALVAALGDELLDALLDYDIALEHGIPLLDGRAWYFDVPDMPPDDDPPAVERWIDTFRKALEEFGGYDALRAAQAAEHEAYMVRAEAAREWSRRLAGVRHESGRTPWQLAADGPPPTGPDLPPDVLELIARAEAELQESADGA